MSTIDANEIKKFANLSTKWWDYNGPFKQLHKMNRIRVAYIKDVLQQQKLISSKVFNGLNVLDIGCGGGILSVALSRLGANVTGLDAAASNISVAKHYAEENDHQINYVQSTAEDFITKNNTYDVVCALEIIEHIADIRLFLQSIIQLTKRGGVIFISTFNKTCKSYLQGVLLAEYVLRMVSIGTHNWNKFIEPSTIVEYLKNCELLDMQGIKFNPFIGEWHFDSRIDVNYIMALKKI